MASVGGAQLERRSSVRRSQSMVLEEDRGSPADEELMLRSQGANCEPTGGGAAPRIGAVLDKDSVAAKSCLAKHEPSGKSLIRIRATSFLDCRVLALCTCQCQMKFLAS
jgi:hypothetical protein